jgi:hypothetical protein
MSGDGDGLWWWCTSILLSRSFSGAGPQVCRGARARIYVTCTHTTHDAVSTKSIEWSERRRLVFFRQAGMRARSRSAARDSGKLCSLARVHRVIASTGEGERAENDHLVLKTEDLSVASCRTADATCTRRLRRQGNMSCSLFQFHAIFKPQPLSPGNHLSDSVL